MSVVGPGAKGSDNITIEVVNKDESSKITSLTINQNLGKPAKDSQYQFSKLKNMFYTSGNMTLANQGVFAYSVGVPIEDQPVLLNIQNQLVAALNRGVANLGPTTQPHSKKLTGYSSLYWGTQKNWYPKNKAQNLFSLFMHTGLSNRTPIFIQDVNPSKCARETTMGQAYGFAYDENGGPTPPVPKQPEVPSKFDPLPSGTTKITITLGPWKHHDKA